MIKRLWIPLMILVLADLADAGAQMTSSPYSIFGAGQVEDNGFGVSKAMGNTGIGLKSARSLNNINPASYQGIDSLAFLFEVCIFGKYTQFKTTALTQQRVNGNFRYLALGFRVTKWWSSSICIVPYSTVGYQIKTSGHIEGDLSPYTKTFMGEGGLNQFYLSNAIRPFKNLSLGVNSSYLFGSISQYETLSSESEFAGYQITKTHYIHNYYFDFGLQYTVNAGKWGYTLGLIYGNKKIMNTKADYFLAYSNDTIDLKGTTEKFIIPTKYGIGLAVEKGKTLRMGVDYERRDWSASHFNNPMLSVRNSERFSAGIEYTPFKNFRDEWYKKMYYRLGGTYQKSYLLIDGIPINTKAISAGVGIPLKNDYSIINVSLEAGQHGTTARGLIQENYFLLHINFSLRDMWFLKPKYD